MDAWWLNPGDHVRRSSPANEAEVERFMLATGQTEECIFLHGLVNSPEFASSLLRNGKCPACEAAI